MDLPEIELVISRKVPGAATYVFKVPVHLLLLR
jgi:hypothetical protein